MHLQDVAGQIDFVLAFAVLHEVENLPALLDELARAMRPRSSCLIAEPTGHVKPEDFEKTLMAAMQAGFGISRGPRIRGCHTAVATR